MNNPAPNPERKQSDVTFARGQRLPELQDPAD
jgi:hypothetical protein